MKKGGEETLSLLVQRAKAQRERDRQWMLLFEELAHYFHTYRKGFVTDFTEGTDLQDDIWCSEPELARSKYAQMFVASACPKDRMWPGVRPAKVELRNLPEVKLWCQLVGQIFYAVLYDPRANFTEKIAEIADDASTFGTAVVTMTRNVKDKHIEMCVEWLKDFTFETDGSGRIGTQYCFKYWTVSRLVNEFGLDALPEELQEQFKQPNANVEKKHEVLHIVMPNSEFERFGLGPRRLKWKSIWVLTCHTEKALDDTGGFHTSPYVVPRWYRTSKEAWGRSDAMKALPDARLAQSVAAALLEITEKQGNPPMQGPIDILRGEIELFPGGFTPFDLAGFQFQGDPLRPVQIGANPALTHEYLSYLEKKIGQHFHADVMQMPEANGRSTMEDQAAWQQRVAAILGPIFSRVENELLPPILDWLFDQLIATRSLPPIPEVLIGERLEYVFDNYIADMREIAEAQRDISAMSVGASMAEVFPEAIENINADEFWRGTYSKMKLPPNYLRPIEEVLEAREQRQQMQQAAQMAEIAKMAGPGMKAGAEAMGQMQGQGGLVPQEAA